MKQNVNERRYPDIIDKAVAFRIAFIPMLYTYDDVNYYDYAKVVCKECHYEEQFNDFLAPKGPASKLERAILDTYEYGVSIEVRNLLIENFDDITEADFRPCRTKRGEIVFYQVTPTHIMVPMAEELGYEKESTCSKCHRSRYICHYEYNEKGNEYNYITKEALEDLHSINASAEELGKTLFYPDYVVSKDVYNFLMERYPRMEFDPLLLKE